MSARSEHLILCKHLRTSLPSERTFDAVFGLSGKVFREHGNRRTIRCEIGGRWYFVKIHGPTGWGEILKNVLRGRSPTLTAQTEWRAIERLKALGVPTMTASGLGIRGRRPAWIDSFIITEELAGMIHLDDLAGDWAGWHGAARWRLKRTVIGELATIARLLHEGGVNHRDFYLCHFMLPDRDLTRIARGERAGLHVIDLHRAQVRRAVPRRWIAKDLSGLLFSSLDAGCTSRDFLRFWRDYRPADWRESVTTDRGFLRLVIRRATRLYASEHGKPPRLPAGLTSF